MNELIGFLDAVCLRFKSTAFFNSKNSMLIAEFFKDAHILKVVKILMNILTPASLMLNTFDTIRTSFL